MDTRQWAEPPGASIGILQTWAPNPFNVRLLTALRHASASNGREKGSQRCRPMARARSLLLTAPDAG